jgi:hypothetical protein
MIKIHRIDSYRDGGSVSILLTNIEPLLLQKLGLPDTPKYAKGKGWIESQYEVWMNHAIRSENKGKYYWGDINGEHIELEEGNEMLTLVLELVRKEREQRLHLIDRFLKIN